MLVSLIVPLYNASAHAETFARCLMSQHCRSFEAVLVDDGSSDGSAEAFSRALTDARFPVRVISQQNAGVSAARNAGLAVATGEYVCFADADDAFAPDYLTALLRGVRVYECAVCLSHVARVKHMPASLDAAPRDAYDPLGRDDFLREMLYRGHPYSLCAGIYRRSLFDGLWFPVGEKYSEDTYVLWRLALRSPRVCVLREPVYWYLEAGDSAMARMCKERMNAVLLIRSLEPEMQKSAPAFAPAFLRFAAARHAWSICWQAAAAFARYKDFAAYIAPFPMRESMRAMLRFPGGKERVSAAAFLISARLYHAAANALLPKSKRRKRI